VDVTPDFPFTTDDLTCTVIIPSTDPDGDTVTYTYEWYKNDILQPGLTTLTTELSVTIDSSNTAEGEVWKCVVIPYGSDPGPPAWDQVTIGAPPPPPVGGYALPINLDLSTSNSLIPQIGLASALSATVTAIIILVKRRKKTLKREH